MCIYYCMIILIKYLIIFGNFNLLKKKTTKIKTEICHDG